MAKHQQVFRIPGAEDESGQSGTLVLTQVKGGPDKMEFEPDTEASEPDPGGGVSGEHPSQLPAQPDEGAQAGQLPAQPPEGEDVQAGQLPAQPPDEEPPSPSQQPA